MIVLALLYIQAFANTPQTVQYAPVDFRYSDKAMMSYKKCVQLLKRNQDRPVDFEVAFDQPLKSLTNGHTKSQNLFKAGM